VRFLSAQALAKVEAFARAGGKVIFLGGPPEWIVEKTYRDAVAGDKHEFFRRLPPSVRVFPRLDAAALSHLPTSDVVLSPAAPDIKYLRRTLKDAEVYFLFNEGASRLEVSAALEGRDKAELWDPRTGERTALRSVIDGGSVRLSLSFEPYETLVVVLGVVTADSPSSHNLRFRNFATLDGDWELNISGKSFSGPLQSWSNLGMAGYWGAGTYRKRFTIPEGSSTDRIWLDLGSVRYAAHVRLNGKDLGRRAWGPFRWNVSTAVQPGANILEIDVANTRANELAGDAKNLKDIEGKGWLKNSYINMYLKFDQEMIPSGLFGPVALVTADSAR
jgi:hypothetical protein